ncbi:MAG: hypothetical protein M1833_002254 [Piccolia ochrophora]|nr:MAG: hypothetical protein M1833_002254 [Piccolia ochrophora]
MYRGPGDKAPRRKSPSRMDVRYACYPPLDHVTCIDNDVQEVDFTVVIQTESVEDSPQRETTIWHNFNSEDDWKELPLQKVDDAHLDVYQDGHSDIAFSERFVGVLKGRNSAGRPVRFTLKSRKTPKEPWKWANDRSSLTDGQLIYQRQLPHTDDLTDYLENLNDNLDIHTELSESPNTKLWSLSSDVASAKHNQSGQTDLVLGLPRHLAEWMALVRIWSPWLAPEHGHVPFSPSKDAVLCSFLRGDGLHLILLAISGVEDVLTVFKPDADGNVVCSSQNERSAVGKARVIASVGLDFESAVAAAMYQARKIVAYEGTSKDEVTREIGIPNQTDPVSPQWFDGWQDGLSYCTWNGLGQKLSEEKIMEALESLERNDVFITNLIIDDNWQSLDGDGRSQFRRGWERFEAIKEGFPNGLKHAVSRIRSKHTNIQHIAVWHAILGYWGGIAPGGEIDQQYKTVDVRIKLGSAFGRPPGGGMRVVDDVDVNQFYADFYAFLADCGIDSVKSDAQFFLDEIQDADDRRRLITKYQDAWTINHLRYFATKAISCMSQIPQILFRSLLPATKPRILLRNSDDFFPDIPSSHPWHLFVNAHNALLTQHLNVLPDWDMFQTSHSYASFHGAARCLSGGPVYITDVPGEHSIPLIQQMTAVTTHGKTIVLRPPLVGKTTRHYTRYDAVAFLHIATYAGLARGAASLLGVFNITPDPHAELLPLSAFPGARPGRAYVVRAHSTGRMSRVLEDVATPSLLVDLPVRGWEILAAYPVDTVARTSSSGNDDDASPLHVTVCGLLGKMTGAAAVLRSDIRVETSGRLRISVVLKALGVLGIYLSPLPASSINTSILVLIQGKVVPRHTVRKGGISQLGGTAGEGGTAKEGATLIKPATITADPHINDDKDKDVDIDMLEIDIATAWKELGLQAGWGNEVGVEVFVDL